MARNAKTGKGRGGLGHPNMRKIKDAWHTKYINRKRDIENKLKAKHSQEND